MSILPRLKIIIADIVTSINNNDFTTLEQKHKIFGATIKKNQPMIDSYVIHENYAGINGLWYIENYLSDDEIQFSENKIATDTKFEPIPKFKNSRRVAHFGYYYSYDRSGLKKAEPIPDHFANIIEPSRINDCMGNKICKTPFNQLIINEYKPGQQIAFHTDHKTQFGDTIACITIGQGVPIKFKLGSVEKK